MTTALTFVILSNDMKDSTKEIIIDIKSIEYQIRIQ